MRWLWHTFLLNVPRRRPSRRPRSESPIALMALAMLIAGGVVAMTALGLEPTASTFVGMGISVAVGLLAAAVATFALRCARPGYVALGTTAAALALWTVIATTGTFAVTTARWVAFGSGLGYVVHAVAILIAHELSPRRVVHVLEVRKLSAR
jgi:hypothetical protein